MSNIEYTDTFSTAFDRAADFLLRNTDWSVDQVIDQLEETTLCFEEIASMYPESCQLCPETELLGMPGFREFHKNDYRIIYVFNEMESTIFAMLFLHQKQSVQKALTDHCLYF